DGSRCGNARVIRWCSPRPWGRHNQSFRKNRWVWRGCSRAGSNARNFRHDDDSRKYQFRNVKSLFELLSFEHSPRGSLSILFSIAQERFQNMPFTNDVAAALAGNAPAANAPADSNAPPEST